MHMQVRETKKQKSDGHNKSTIECIGRANSVVTNLTVTATLRKRLQDRRTAQPLALFLFI